MAGCSWRAAQHRSTAGLGLRRAVRPRQRVLDRHREHDRGPLGSHGHAAARRQGARGGRCRRRSASARWPPPSCTTRAPGPGPPPGAWSTPRRATRPRCCPMAGCSWRAASASATARRHWPPPSCTTRRTGSWTATGSMIDVRGGHTATLLPDGRVLVVGGVLRQRRPASAELYDPGSGTWTATATHARGPRRLTRPRCCPMARCSWRAAAPDGSGLAGLRRAVRPRQPLRSRSSLARPRRRPPRHHNYRRFARASTLTLQRSRGQDFPSRMSRVRIPSPAPLPRF